MMSLDIVLSLPVIRLVLKSHETLTSFIQDKCKDRNRIPHTTNASLCSCSQRLDPRLTMFLPPPQRLRIRRDSARIATKQVPNEHIYIQVCRLCVAFRYISILPRTYRYIHLYADHSHDYQPSRRYVQLSGSHPPVRLSNLRAPRFISFGVFGETTRTLSQLPEQRQ